MPTVSGIHGGGSHLANKVEAVKKGVQPPLADVETMYGIRVQKCVPVRAVWKLTTDRGEYALKKVVHAKEKLMFIYQATEHLWKNGFTNLARFIPTREGHPFIEGADGRYFLTEWIEGRESDLEDPAELKQAVELMARFHLASRGFVPTIDAMTKTRWAGWIERFEKELQDLVTQKLRIMETPSDQWTEMEQVFMQTIEPMLEMAEMGVKLLHQSDFPQVLGRERKLRGFIHGDFTYHNFILTADGNMSVIDFDYCAFELRVHDLARFMRKMLRRSHWDVDLGHTILSDYHAIAPLCDGELEVLRAVLYFPQRYWRAVERGFVSRRYSPQNAMKKMKQEVADIEQWRMFMQKYPSTL
jgi:CotS family spore coat protein